MRKRKTEEEIKAGYRKRYLKWKELNQEHAKEYAKEYREKNKEHIKQQLKKYNILNKERLALKKREYALKNKDNIKKYHKEYYLKNKNKILNERHDYFVKNKSEILKKNKELYSRNKKIYNKNMYENKKKKMLADKEFKEKIYEAVRKYRKTHKHIANIRAKKRVVELHDCYIKNLLTKNSPNLHFNDIPQEFVNAYREVIKLKRILKRGEQKDE